jgi:hypothetical protein
VKHISHFLTTANLLANQNKFANGIVPEGTEPIEYGVFDKLDLDSKELEIVIENKVSAVSIQKSTKLKKSV